MRLSFPVAVSLALVLASAAASGDPASRITAAGILSDTKALSDDAMGGAAREALATAWPGRIWSSA